MKREPQSGNHETLPDAVTRSHRLHLCTQRAYPQQGRLGMSNKTKNSRVRLRHWFQISAMAAAIGSAPASYGASFYLLEQSPAHLGHAFAGTASNINDASTVYFNPAGMAQLDGKQLTAGLNAVTPRARFRDEGSNTGNLRARTSESAIVPTLYYTHRMNDQWAFGLGLTVPFGLSSDYGTQWPGRYLATFSELELISLSATAAYSFNETLDRKSTRLNSSHVAISYAVFCLKKKR